MSAAPGAAPAGASAFSSPGGETAGEARITVVTDKMKVVLSSVGRRGRERHLRRFQEEGREPRRARSRRGRGRARARPSAERRMEEALRGSASRRSSTARPSPTARASCSARGARRRRSFSGARGPRASTSKSGSPSRAADTPSASAIALRREGEMAHSAAYSIGWESGLASSETDLKLGADEVRGARHGRGRVLPGAAEQVLEGDEARVRRHGRLGRGADEVFPERAHRGEGEPGLGHARPPRRAGQGLRRLLDRVSVPRATRGASRIRSRGTSAPST